MMRIPKNRGVSLIEMLLGVSILTMVVISLLGTFHVFLKATGDGIRAIKAEYLAEEGMEAVRAVRDSGWDAIFAPLALDTELYVAFEGGGWQTTTTPEVIDGLFERSFILRGVVRDGNDDIATTGTLDAGTRFVEVSVVWEDRGTTTEKVIKGYFTDLF